jgi:hypothetical protein
MVETISPNVLHSNLSFPLLSLLILVSPFSVSYLNLPKSLFCFEAFLIVVYCLCLRFPWIVVGYSWFTWSVRLIYICIVLSTYVHCPCFPCLLAVSFWPGWLVSFLYPPSTTCLVGFPVSWFICLYNRVSAKIDFCNSAEVGIFS